MRKQYLVAVDLEGIHGVVGESYQALLQGSPEYAIAVQNAIKEVNTVVKALFESQAETVAVWDNHSSGNNLDFSLLDPRIVRVENKTDGTFSRFGFQKEIAFDGVFYIGYHAKAGTLNGVLSHTYSSKDIQYYKINGEQVGEFDIDAYIAAERGIPALLIASDDACVKQVKQSIPEIGFVITKYGKGRNKADFIEENEVLDELYRQASLAAQQTPKPVKLPFPCEMEARFTRMEDAEKALQFLQSIHQPVSYGEDTHTIRATVSNMEQLERFMWRK